MLRERQAIRARKTRSVGALPAQSAAEVVRRAVALQQQLVARVVEQRPRRPLPPLARPVIDNSTSTLSTVSQPIGVSKKAANVAIDWNAVQERTLHRNDLAFPCAICQEPFLRGSRAAELLLSCSHVFHEACLTSYERFVTMSRPAYVDTSMIGGGTNTQSHACPVCRCANYKKQHTSMASNISQHYAAVRIQAAWRCYHQRALYQRHLALNPPKHSLLRQKWVETKLQDQTRSLIVRVQNSSRQIDHLLDSVDADQIHRQQVMNNLSDQLTKMSSQVSTNKDTSTKNSPSHKRIASSSNVPDVWPTPLLSSKRQVNTIDWRQIYQKCLERMPTDCPICLMSLFAKRRPTKNPKIVNVRLEDQQESDSDSESSDSHSTEDEASKEQPSVLCPKQKPLYLLSCTHVFHQPCLDAFELFRLADPPSASQTERLSSPTQFSSTSILPPLSTTLGATPRTLFDDQREVPMGVFSLICPVCRSNYAKVSIT